MSKLEQVLHSACRPKNWSDDSHRKWEEFIKLLKTCNFEQALTSFQNPDDISDHVRSVIWNTVVHADWKAMMEIALCDDAPLLSRLFKFLLNSNRREIHVVTTNYDRIAECAVEKAGYHHYAGFTYGYLRRLNSINGSKISLRQS